MIAKKLSDAMILEGFGTKCLMYIIINSSEHNVWLWNTPSLLSQIFLIETLS